MAFPTVTVTPGTGQTINTLPNAGQASMANSLPVAIASDQGTFAVTGTFWQTTQPVSIATMPTTPVTGTFWQATQPVSATALPLPTGAATETTLAALNTKTPALGQAAMAASQPVVLASDQTALTVGGISAVATATFNRPADTTAYTVGDLVANSTTAGSVVPLALTVARVNGGTGLITRCRLSTSHTGLTGTDSFRVHLFKTSPTAANGDNGVFSVNGVAAVHLGYFDVTLDRIFSDGAKGFSIPAVGSQIVFDAAAGTTNIFVLIEARSGYTPASGETFTVALEVQRD